jgi:hypothetical protein
MPLGRYRHFGKLRFNGKDFEHGPIGSPLLSGGLNPFFPGSLYWRGAGTDAMCRERGFISGRGWDDLEGMMESILGGPLIPPGRGLKLADYQEAANALGCEVSAIYAVDRVESGGSGFIADGRLKILFEAHWFSKLTEHKYDAALPGISSRKWNRALYAAGKNADVRGVKELARLALAMVLDDSAAIQSASYGRYQIMGFNYSLCGFMDAYRMVLAFEESEKNHLLAFVEFCKSKKLAPAIRRKDWNSFAYLYNGKSYKTNRYDEKLALAERNFNTAKIA